MASRDWCFTSYRESPPALELPERVNYLVFQREKCPETGRLHWQGFVCFKTAVRKKGAQELLSLPKVHFEPRSKESTRQQAADYCKKQDSRFEPYVEFGELPQQGKRNDLLLCKRKLESGCSFNSLFQDDETFVQATKYHRGLLLASRIFQKPPARDSIRVFVHYGTTGTGKTRTALDRWPNAYLLEPPQQGGGTVWFDDYNGEEELLVDEYTGWLPWVFLLRLLDRYKMKVQCKGGSYPLHATTICLTSNKPPQEWHPRQNIAPLMRRITNLYEFKTDVVIRHSS